MQEVIRSVIRCRVHDRDHDWDHGVCCYLGKEREIMSTIIIRVGGHHRSGRVSVLGQLLIVMDIGLSVGV